VTEALTQRNRAAKALFAPLAPTYDRYARLLSFGQDPRWRSFLVSRIDARPDHTVLDVATGTGAVALELMRRYDCHVIGVDQSPEMLDAARARANGVEFREARAEDLPFEDGSFDGLTFTYLLRYVDDPGATMSELARVVRPGGRIAMLEFAIPENPLARISWNTYVKVGLPIAGRLISEGWHEVGKFLGPSIRDFWARNPLERLLPLWSEAGIDRVQARTLSLGGGIIVWGIRGD
jgi:demethylmenaquinone methyltransferase/2-methoxy-6-polyprenyl-1,4-benzoquinol methylase